MAPQSRLFVLAILAAVAAAFPPPEVAPNFIIPPNEILPSNVLTFGVTSQTRTSAGTSTTSKAATTVSSPASTTSTSSTGPAKVQQPTSSPSSTTVCVTLPVPGNPGKQIPAEVALTKLPENAKPPGLLATTVLNVIKSTSTTTATRTPAVIA